MTNGDRIRKMTDEQLIELFNKRMRCRGCKEDWEEWIKQEVKGND